MKLPCRVNKTFAPWISFLQRPPQTLSSVTAAWSVNRLVVLLQSQWLPQASSSFLLSRKDPSWQAMWEGSGQLGSMGSSRGPGTLHLVTQLSFRMFPFPHGCRQHEQAGGKQPAACSRQAFSVESQTVNLWGCPASFLFWSHVHMWSRRCFSVYGLESS